MGRPTVPSNSFHPSTGSTTPRTSSQKTIMHYIRPGDSQNRSRPIHPASSSRSNSHPKKLHPPSSQFSPSQNVDVQCINSQLRRLSRADVCVICYALGKKSNARHSILNCHRKLGNSSDPVWMEWTRRFSFTAGEECYGCGVPYRVKSPTLILRHHC